MESLNHRKQVMVAAKMQHGVFFCCDFEAKGRVFFFLVGGAGGIAGIPTLLQDLFFSGPVQRRSTPLNCPVVPSDLPIWEASSGLLWFSPCLDGLWIKGGWGVLKKGCGSILWRHGDLLFF